MPERKSLIAVAKIAFRVLLLALVAWGIWRTIAKARGDFEAKEFSFSSLRLAWIVVAGFAYLLGLLPSALFWRRTMRSMQQSPGLLPTLRAYYIGHLGKYVPGKALVVVLRTVLIRGPGVDTTVAATSVFVETLTFMAVGAAMATVCLTMAWRELHIGLYVLAVAILLVTGIPTLPPIFRRIIGVMRLARANPKIQSLVAGIDYRLIVGGWLSIAIGWLLLGVSLWATLMAMPTTVDVKPDIYSFPILVASVALAMVAGFLSLLPGGIGVREWVVMTLVAPTFGAAAAVVSAILLRVVWLLSEVLISVILWLSRPTFKSPAS